ncbi:MULTISPECIES: leucyl/phenylalanyl-tRNA--protein transferase [Marivita]|uniref:Leucyl/phenylalanyl-tRNA--protein transferase n=1 Tax=Marivita cryptomonadis TaxID=505252 RepID=A0A9Q2P0S0_9RHOB|nr:MULTISPECIES: leucyl/phenylalanyl-tRNA--protein transferase [Marivita]MCR9169091.1 leucyl/phenylalanyl-tRNA--protein transferase [Paracoccaceae bacterium]MBM2323639.1 leucyl/phenylalanyl-tRNA--protein transferase [Marivita cryptomonadis]MBM2333226.1 leucyl/phenylalanyl-tRNA--protein transferase [Marivita cryptomonadis]MBM2342805.1 leucyl/phenylalanyl-tRNA--protein transferase [Marivita cryptomonadis]MBM2347474.1 leucyl/phenylalanyl-tRNA--protein transferase [Marivita cryptomonadis]
MTVTPELLLQAYRVGVFPMAEHRDDPEMFWVDPRKRGVFPLDGFRISRSLSKTLKRNDYYVTLNTAFDDVIDACADRSETWINQEIRGLYNELHHQGHAHSLEVWADSRLIGGVYGVAVGGAFCGESMFSRQRDASKVALAWLIDLLRRTGFVLFDTQFLTHHLASLGAIEITRAEYRAYLAQALRITADLSSAPLAASGQDVVQRNTQTS